MASFNKSQINSARVEEVRHWASKGGWENVRTLTMPPYDYIVSVGIFELYLTIDGQVRHFYSKGAKEYGLEYLD